MSPSPISQPPTSDFEQPAPIAPAELLGTSQLDELVAQSASIAYTATLEQAHLLTAPFENGYFAVLDNDRPIGLGSRDRMGLLMGSRFGFALFCKLPVTEALVPAPMYYCADSPVEALLQQALHRSGSAFHEDVILVDADGRFRGLIPTWKLAQLQSRLLAAQMNFRREQEATLRRTNLDLFRKVAALRQSEARYRSLFNHSSTGFALLNPDGLIANANGRLLQLLDTTDGAPVSFCDFLPLEQRAALLDRSPDRAPSPIIPTEFSLQVPGRSDRLVRLHLAWIPETGQWSVALDDITEERLLQASAIEREKRSLLESLAGGIAHELNNKLSPILGFAGLLTAGVTPIEATDFGEIIGRSAKEAARIIQQLLHLSKPVLPRRETFELCQFVQETLTLLSFRLRDAGITVVTPVTAGPLDIHADPGQIRQVLLNLCLNAIDAMCGRPIRTLTLAIQTAPGQFRLSIADTGTGIAPGNLKRIFQPFFTTKSPHAGTGLGLSVCVSIVDQHGGSIAARNLPESGAEFTIQLPRLAAPAPEKQIGFDVTQIARLRLEGGVLVVEDEDVVAHLVQEVLLRYFDCEVVRATNGAEALDRCALGRFACIVSDLCMPIMNGMDFYERLHSGSPELARRVLFMSGYEDDPQYRSRLAASGRPVLSKPFDPPELVRLILPYALQG